MDLVEGARVRFNGSTDGDGWTAGKPWKVGGNPIPSGTEGTVRSVAGGWVDVALDDGRITSGELRFFMMRACVVKIDLANYPHECPRCRSACYLGAVPNALDCSNAKCPSKLR